MKESQKMSWEEWVTKVSKDMQEDPMFAGPTEQVSQGLTFDCLGLAPEGRHDQ
jgi:hypothetical protein